VSDERQTMTLTAWEAEGRARFGEDRHAWQFVCPVCQHVASARDYQRAGAPAGAVAFSCVGRWIEGSGEAFRRDQKGPCTYAGGGLFRLNPITITDEHGKTVGELFAFAPATTTKDP
jgi:hypothetical protein